MTKNYYLPPAKPELPRRIETIDQGKAFLELLETRCWFFHPDADAVTAFFPEYNSPTLKERRRLNRLMDDCAQLQCAEFDVYAWFELSNAKQKKN